MPCKFFGTLAQEEEIPLELFAYHCERYKMRLRNYQEKQLNFIWGPLVRGSLNGGRCAPNPILHLIGRSETRSHPHMLICCLLPSSFVFNSVLQSVGHNNGGRSFEMISTGLISDTAKTWHSNRAVSTFPSSTVAVD